MKIFKKVFALLVVVVVIFSNSVWTYAADTEECESRQVSLIEAENVAVSHIQGVMALDESSAWNNGVRIKVRKALFDLDDEIEAYYFGLVGTSHDKIANAYIQYFRETGLPCYPNRYVWAGSTSDWCMTSVIPR